MRRLLVTVAVVAGSSTACASSAPDSIGDRAASGPSVAVTTTAPAAPTMVASSPVPQTVRRASASTEPASTVAGGAAFDTSGLNAFVSAVATVQPRLDRPLSVRDIRVASPRAVLDGYEDSVVGVSATVQVGGG